jgi:hypothetical protein
MIRFTPKKGLHYFVQQTTILQKDRFGYYHEFICVCCKLRCRRYKGASKYVLEKADRRVFGCTERRRYPDRFRKWQWKSFWKYDL